MTTPYVLALTIPWLPKLPNRLQRAHWRVVSKHANEWHLRVRAAVGQDGPEKPLDRARVTFIRHSAVEPDPDGLVASVKAPLDGLVRAGVLVDDKRKHVELEVSWQQAKRGKGYLGIGVMELG